MKKSCINSIKLHDIENKDDIVSYENHDFSTSKDKGDLVFCFRDDQRVTWKLDNNKLDIEVVGDMTENAKLMIDIIKKMLEGEKE